MKSKLSSDSKLGSFKKQSKDTKLSYFKVSHRLKHGKLQAKFKSWNSDEVFKQVKEFHDAKAREPPGLKEARHHLSEVIKHLHQYFHGSNTTENKEAAQQRKIAKRFEYTGSTYEGLKIPSKETLEFDIMVILDKGVFLKIDTLPKRPAHVTLSPRWRHRGRFWQVLDRKLVSPEKATGAFFRQVQLCFNDWNEKHGDTNTSIKPVQNGPATKLQVLKGDDVWYYVDLVPAYEVFVKRSEDSENGGTVVRDESQIYVAKPYQGPKKTHMDKLTWRRSFSMQEKELLITIDKDNGCRKQCIRALKAVREKESVLEKVLCSYHIKTTVMTMCRKQPTLPWRNKDLPQRLREVMNNLANDLDQWRMEHYYLSNYNLLFGTNRKACKNAARRLKKLASKKSFFLNAFDKDAGTLLQTKIQNKNPKAKKDRQKKYQKDSKKGGTKNTENSKAKVRVKQSGKVETRKRNQGFKQKERSRKTTSKKDGKRGKYDKRNRSTASNFIVITKDIKSWQRKSQPSVRTVSTTEKTTTATGNDGESKENQTTKPQTELNTFEELLLNDDLDSPHPLSVHGQTDLSDDLDSLHDPLSVHGQTDLSDDLDSLHDPSSVHGQTDLSDDLDSLHDPSSVHGQTDLSDDLDSLHDPSSVHGQTDLSDDLESFYDQSSVYDPTGISDSSDYNDQCDYLDDNDCF